MGDREGGHGRDVAERLVVGPGQAVDELQALAAEHPAAVLEAEALRHQLGVAVLAPRPVLETDREGLGAVAPIRSR